MKNEIRSYIYRLIGDIASVDTDWIMIAVIVVCAVIVLDSVLGQIRRKSAITGVKRETATVSIDGSKTLPIKDYVSEMQGLAGRPDAVISEDGFIIPIERKPLAKKIRDRYVAQLLVYMRLIEEFEGKKPPYGYLILGPSCRKIKIENSDARQAWLQKMLDEMHQILDGKAQATPSPFPSKCSKCNMRNACSYRASELVPVEIRNTAISNK